MLDKEGYKGLDVRGDGGQVVAAPSLHPNGGSYAWIEGGGLGDLEIAECPAWLKAMIEGEKPQERIEPPVEETIPEGARDATLTSMAGTMRRKGFSEAAIEAALLETNRAQCQPPLSDDQVRKIVRSIGSKPPGTNVAQGKTQARIPVAELFSVVEDDPNPIELIAGMFPRGDVSLMFGKAGCGKTIFIDYLARQLSEGGTIMGGCLLKNEPARKVVFFEAEVTKKLFANRKYDFGWGGNAANLKYIFQSELVKRGMWLDFATDGEYFREIFKQERPDLVVFDTMQGFHSLDENRASDMKTVMTCLKQWAAEFNCAIVIIHHARKGNTQFKKERLTEEDAQGSNIILRQPGAVYLIERLKLEERQLTVFSLRKDWGDGEQDDWFGYEIKRGFYDEKKHLVFELYPNTGSDKGGIIKNAISSQSGWFSFGDVQKRLPGVSESYIRKILNAMANVFQPPMC
jgi:hypothetical protein